MLKQGMLISLLVKKALFSCSRLLQSWSAAFARVSLVGSFGKNTGVSCHAFSWVLPKLIERMCLLVNAIRIVMVLTIAPLGSLSSCLIAFSNHNRGRNGNHQYSTSLKSMSEWFSELRSMATRELPLMTLTSLSLLAGFGGWNGNHSSSLPESCYVVWWYCRWLPQIRHVIWVKHCGSRYSEMNCYLYKFPR